MQDENTQIRKIMLSVNRIDGIYYQWARKIGLKENMLSLLYALSNGEPYTQKQISEEWLIPKTTINTVIKECILNGYIVLQHEPHTKEKRICLTDIGKEYAESVLCELKAAEMQAFDKTRKKYAVEFVEVLEEFANQLNIAFEESEIESVTINHGS